MTYSRIDRRAVLAAGASLLASGAAARTPPCRPTRVLFVCPAGTVKSAIAREVLKHRAAERGVAVRAQSRGVHLENHVSPALAARLQADGIDPRAEPVRALISADLAGQDIVIAFDEAAQAPGLGGARVWEVPSWNADYAHAKSALSTYVEALLDELKARPCPA